jgi:hypothetical protein
MKLNVSIFLESLCRKLSCFELRQTCRVFYKRHTCIDHNITSVLLKVQHISSNFAKHSEAHSMFIFSKILCIQNNVKDTEQGDKPQLKI